MEPVPPGADHPETQRMSRRRRRSCGSCLWTPPGPSAFRFLLVVRTPFTFLRPPESGEEEQKAEASDAPKELASTYGAPGQLEHVLQALAYSRLVIAHVCVGQPRPFEVLY